jgi:hypothetical protein
MGIPGQRSEKERCVAPVDVKPTSDNRVTSSGICDEFCQGFAVPTERNCYQLDSTEQN